MRLLFILDPVSDLKPAKDSSLAMMREAIARGHEVWVAGLADMSWRDQQVILRATQFAFAEGHIWYEFGEVAEFEASGFDAILMRKDPPFDHEYLYATYLLELAELHGARVINHPAAVRDWNEKLAVAHFPQFAPAFLVSKDPSLITSFLQQQGDIVLKPLDGMGGSSVFRVQLTDPNLGVIIETMTQHGQRTVMAQRYLPEIVDGDKRILLIDGVPVPHCLARIPKAGETRANLAVGGRGEARALTARDLEIALAVGKVAKQKGLMLVGLDVIGDYLTEINVTSPTCMVEIAAQTDSRPAALMLDALERL
ncbi:MAG: glutathione synthase [Candidatus Methylopumilus sp.]|jgi:glutathione synthase|nr:glutathione synthase [Candidatus Methylopumilus sp.]NBW60454.1 glutathione synthase [Methylophilaceae bacterium]